VTDDAGNSRSLDRIIHVSAVPPPPNQLPAVPTFTVSPRTPTVNELVTFKATASDPDGTIERIDWDFENDGKFDASGETVQRTFTSGGNTTVLVQVTDNRGGQRSSFQSSSSRPAARQGRSQRAAAIGPDADARTTPTTVERDPPAQPDHPPARRDRQRQDTDLAPAGLRRAEGREGPRALPRRRLPEGSRGQHGTDVRPDDPPTRVRAGAEPRGYHRGLRDPERPARQVHPLEIMRTKAPIRTDKCVRSYGKKPSSCPSGD
jgi:hypothetical protein